MSILLLACTPASLPIPTTDSVVELPEDTALEQIPGIGEGLCRIELDCGQEIPDEPKVECALRVESSEGHALFEGEAGVEVRGRSSSGFPKKQFAVELRDAGEAIEVDLFGMGAESDWVLNGAWIDRALVRNKYGYDLYQALNADHYGPESRTCTLRLEGRDQGVYFLVERVKRDAARIDIAEDGWVVKLDDVPGVQSNEAVGYGHWAAIHDGGSAGADLAAWQASVLNDPSGIFEHLDRDSAMDFVLLQEFMKNNDAYYLSVHLWRDAEGPIHFTPWDLDLTFGQPTYNDNVPPEGWILYRPTWVAAMDFDGELADRWFELREGPLSDEAALARYEAQYTLLGDAAEANFEVWDWDEIDFLGGYLPVVEDYEAEADKIRAWIPARLAWIDENIEQY